jgi:hypothetical protein
MNYQVMCAAASILALIASNQYKKAYDYNNDGKLNVRDAIRAAAFRFDEEMTVDGSIINKLIENNYAESCIYWEFCEVNNEVCRAYSFSTKDNVTATIYCEFEDYSTEYFTIKVIPSKKDCYIIG